MGRIVSNQARVATAAPGAAVLVAGSLLADLAAVAAYVVAGRLAHDETLSAAGLVATGWPFLVGLLGGYLGVTLMRWPTLSLRGGSVVVLKTLVIGLVLRYGVAGDATPASFVAVTTVVLAALMLGWRAVALGVLRPR